MITRRTISARHSSRLDTVAMLFVVPQRDFNIFGDVSDMLEIAMAAAVNGDVILPEPDADVNGVKAGFYPEEWKHIR
ncbi:hypothetical protein DPMN_132266 [Dreissena polymorpha]|uniref:Uncharacterized protein n=1 Tax=Dreissena polymorpha TaxID=45954 RepID=A0A9D4FR92_DREPO|nr:hypothetical protein DPMN_132266 [Dreissena polymorpha]